MPDNIWARLQARCEATCPALPQGGLNPPATPRQIEAVEALVGQRLPDDLREAYLHFNGMQREALNGHPQRRALQVLMGQFHWIDLELLACDWTMYRCIGLRTDPELLGMPTDEIEGKPVRPRVNDEAWLPIGRSGTSVTAFIDLNPSAWGTRGQLLLSDPEGDGPVLMATSLRHAISTTLDAFDRGAVTWDGWSLVSTRGLWLPRACADWEGL